MYISLICKCIFRPLWTKRTPDSNLLKKAHQGRTLKSGIQMLEILSRAAVPLQTADLSHRGFQRRDPTSHFRITRHLRHQFRKRFILITEVCQLEVRFDTTHLALWLRQGTLVLNWKRKFTSSRNLFYGSFHRKHTVVVLRRSLYMYFATNAIQL